MSDLNFLIELWMDPDMNARESTLAACSDRDCAQAAYERALTKYPTRLVTLSNKAMIMRRSDREAPPGTIPLFRQTEE